MSTNHHEASGKTVSAEAEKPPAPDAGNAALRPAAAVQPKPAAELVETEAQEPKPARKHR